VNRAKWLSKLETVLENMQVNREIEEGVIVSAEVEAVDAFINGLALRAILSPDEWPAERQLAELRRYLNRLQ